MPRRSSSSNEHQIAINKKSKEKPTYKIIVLGCGGVGKVSLKIHLILSYVSDNHIMLSTYIHLSLII
jgi:GTPase SAR1 family protein